MPQLDISMFPTQIFWLLVTFIPLLFVVWRVVVPRVSETLESRQKRIEDNIERAANIKKEAESAVAAYEKSLSEAQNNAIKIMSDAQRQLTEEMTSKEKEVSAQVDSLLIESQDRIQSAIANALENINDIAEELTSNTTQLLLKDKIDATTISKAVQNAIKENK